MNISSVAAHFAANGGGAYHVSKFAGARFTEFAQDEYGRQVSPFSPFSPSTVKLSKFVRGEQGLVKVQVLMV